MEAIVVITTVGTEQEANLLTEELLDRRLAACVNIVSGVRSHYRWRGSICKDSEYLLVIKTLAEAYDEVAATIRELHSYEQPEILSLEVSRGDAGFVSWIAECVGPEVAEAEYGEADVDDPESDESP